jgi:hypothetical protein
MMKRIIELDGDLDEDVMELLLVSGKLKTPEQIIRQFVLDAIDPIDATGPTFIWEVRPDNPMYISLEVPDRYAKVDLARAVKISKLDASACALVLERDHSTEATLRVYRNTLDWLRFLSVRHPNELCREEFSQQLEIRKAGLAELKTKASLRFRFDVLDELKTM